ncbi:MAG: protein kinase [Lachnospiraceae bacterium]|nr:protein kinase [Lachnospiraceae bacterium]
MLINPEVDAEDDVAWICDQCGAMLNIQEGFRQQRGEWACTECGFVNKIAQSELYQTEDEFQASVHDPYKGLADDDALALSMYLDLENVAGREDIVLVKHRESGILYVKKLLRTYEKSIYEYLKIHPVAYMPEIIGVYEGSNCLVIIEECIAGKTIVERLDEGTLTIDDSVRIAKSICSILQELHTLPTPIIHRDIKPSNVMITPDGEVFLLDMNVAKWYDPKKTDDTNYLGTPHFAAPEQVGYGLKASSAKSDIYALGMLMNVMITGKFPKEEKAEGKIWGIIERCISLNAEDRYTAEELLQALTAIEEV